MSLPKYQVPMHCKVSETDKHTCHNLNSNDNLATSVNTPFSSLTQYNKSMSRFHAWIKTGQYVMKTDNVKGTLDNDDFITAFSPCSILPVISILIENRNVSCIIDSGASRCLVSDTMAVALWGSDILQSLEQNVKICLKDINDQFIQVLGTCIIHFKINNSDFSHEFVFFRSTKKELLIGIDFLKTNKIAIHPNLGLFYEQDEKICKLGQPLDPIFPVFIKEDITLQPGDQQVINVYIQHDPLDPNLHHLIQNCMVVHSENLEPDLEFSELQIYFQYVVFDAYLTTDVLLCNHSQEMIHYKACSLVGHAEPIRQVATVHEIHKDQLSAALVQGMQNLDGKSLNVPESKICIDLPEHSPITMDKINCHSENQADLEWLLKQHEINRAIFSTHDWDVGTHRGSEISFQVKTNCTVHCEKYVKINPKVKDRADEIIAMLLSRNLIEVSNSPWSSRVLFVEKAPEDKKIITQADIPGQKMLHKSSKLRMVVDFRNLNGKLKQLNSCWPAPTIKDILGELHNATYLSTLDITQGFWSYPIKNESRKYTAFIYNDCVYHFRRLPQGLSISSKCMQFKMKSFVLRHNLKNCTVYIDNVLIWGESREDYINNLISFFQACATEGIKLKYHKCHHFIVKDFILFGFQINLVHKTITPEPAKVTKIMEIIPPNNKKRLKAFIGAIAYFSDMIPMLQADLGPLHDISGPNSKFVWSESCQNAFDLVKRNLSKLNLIYIMRPDRPIHATTDAAAGSSVSYSLWQYDDGFAKLVPLKHNSHKMSPTEKNLSQWESEGLATVFCITKESALLSFGNLVLHTDARGLTFVNRYANSNSKLSRWDILLRSYNMTIHFLPNTSGCIKVTDLFTRNSLTGGQKNKRVTKKELEEFISLDFSGMPDLNIHDCMALISKIFELYHRLPLPVDSLRRIKEAFPSPAPIQSQINEGPEIVKYAQGNLVATVVTCSDPLAYQETPFTELPATNTFSIPSLDWDREVSAPVQIREILQNYLCSMSVANLIAAQSSDNWISKSFKNCQDGTIFKYQNIIMRKYQLLNGAWVSQIILPEQMAEAMINRYHRRPYIKHESITKMKRHLETLFYIRGYNRIAQKIINSCNFCALNKVHPHAQLGPAMKIMVSAPRQFLYLDICTVRSDSEQDSFLTILDAFSKFVIYLPISRSAQAEEIVDLIFKFWVRMFNFPVAICTDGAKNLVNKMVGEICGLMNTKLVRISPGHSQSNCSERYNLLCIQALKIFEQSYGLTDQTYDTILSLTGQMCNQSLNQYGFSPYFLHYGTEPRKNSFISMRNLSLMQNMDIHVQQLAKAQNVCHFLSRQMEKRLMENENKTQLGTKYNVGDFVLIRKLKIQGPRHGHKLQQIYYPEPFRIIKRYKTNVLAVPFNRRFIKNRLKGEGAITKNMAILARISRLKPVKNPLRLLHLNVSETILRDFNDALKLPCFTPNALEIMPLPNIEQNADTIVKDFNPTIHFQPEASVEKTHTPVSPLIVKCPSSGTAIMDICNLQLVTLKPGHTESPLLSATTCSTADSSSNIWGKLIPTKQRQVTDITESFDTDSRINDFKTRSSIFQHDMDDNVEPFVNRGPDGDLGSSSHSSESSFFTPTKFVQGSDEFLLEENNMDSATPARPIQSLPGDKKIISSRPQLSGKKSRASKKSVLTEISLPSGKKLVFQRNPPADKMVDLKTSKTSK